MTTGEQLISQFSKFRQPDSQKTPVLNYYKNLHSFGQPEHVSAVTDSAFSLLGRWGWGPSYAVAQDSQFVVLGNGSLLQILAWNSKTSSPTLISEYDVGTPIYQIRVQDSLAYIIGGGGFLILNLRVPDGIEPLGSLHLSDIFLTLEVVDSIAYVTTWFGALDLIDIKDRLSPQLISHVSALSDRAVTLAVKDGYCYVGGLDAPLLNVFDARKPDSVQSIGYLGLKGLSQYAVIADTVLIIGVRSTSTIQFYSVTSPATPTLLDSLNIPGIDTFSINGLKVVGSHLYVSTDNAGFYDIDLVDSAHPFIALHRLFPYKTSSGGSVANSTNEMLYVACDNGLAYYDMSDTLRYVGFFPTAGNIAKISIQRNIGALAATTGGVWLLDISDPHAPKQISNINNGGNTVDVILSAEHLIMYDQQLWGTRTVTEGVYIYDISDSLHPALLSTYIPPPLGFNVPDGITMYLDSSLLFLAQEQTTDPPQTDIEVINLIDPLHPKQLNQITVPFLVVRMAASLGALYAASRDSGLYIFDYKSLPSINEVENIRNLGTVFSLTLHDSLMFLHTGESISVYGITQPEIPDSISSFAVNSIPPYDMPVANSVLYCQIIDSISGVASIDISAPRKLTQNAFIPETNDIALSAYNAYLLLAWPEVGITLFQNNLILDVENNKDQETPGLFQLEQNYPNPFNPVTTITFEISHSANVSLKIYDLLGREIATLVNDITPSGIYHIQWNANNVPSGLYFCQLKVRPLHSTSRPSVNVKKMVLIK